MSAVRRDSPPCRAGSLNWPHGEPSRISTFDPGGKVYSRVDGLSAQNDGIWLVRHEGLTANPLGTLAAIYGFIGEQPATHPIGSNPITKG